MSVTLAVTFGNARWSCTPDMASSAFARFQALKEKAIASVCP
jgi:hypothetical protein